MRTFEFHLQPFRETGRKNWLESPAIVASGETYEEAHAAALAVLPAGHTIWTVTEITPSPESRREVWSDELLAKHGLGSFGAMLVQPLDPIHLNFGAIWSAYSDVQLREIERATSPEITRREFARALVIEGGTMATIGIWPDGRRQLAITTQFSARTNGQRRDDLFDGDPRLPALLNRTEFLRRWWERLANVVFSARTADYDAGRAPASAIFIGKEIEDDHGRAGEDHPEWAQISAMTFSTGGGWTKRHRVLYLADHSPQAFNMSARPSRILGVSQDENTGKRGLLLRTTLWQPTLSRFQRLQFVVPISNIDAFEVMYDALLQAGEIDE
jgi:hypothetical protein